MTNIPGARALSAAPPHPVAPPGLPAGTRLLLLGLLLLAFALRAYHLDFQSFWSDEGISLRRAAQPFDEMLAAMPVEHAPGYFVALRAWRVTTGDTDYGLRFFSLWPSVLAVALIARLAHDLATPAATARRIAVVAAALLATNAFQVWYAQEARMYTWLLAASLGSSWAFWRILTHPQKWGWAVPLYSLTTAACVYLHYFGALTPIAHTLTMLGWVIGQRTWRTTAAWAAGAAGALLLFAPWLPRSFGIFGFEGWREPGNPAEIPVRYWRAYTVSDAMPPLIMGWLPWLYLALALVGAGWWLARRRAAGMLLLALFLIPLGGVLLLALRTPDYHERYAIALVGPLLLLTAGGVGALTPGAWRKTRMSHHDWLVPALATTLLVAANSAALLRHYSDASLHKPDYRAAARRIEEAQRHDDVILVDGPNPELVFAHYYRGGLPIHDLRHLEGADADYVDRTLRAATEGAGRAWELLYFHPPAAAQVWLATQAWAAEPSFHNGIRVTPYGIGQGDGETHAHALAYGDALMLERSTVAPLRVQAGEIVRVTTDWWTHSTPPDLKFSVRLVDTSGTVVNTWDYVPQNWFAPTPVWVVEQPARDQRGILISDTLPAGRYTVALRVYDAATGAPVVTAAGDDLALAEIEVLP